MYLAITVILNTTSIIIAANLLHKHTERLDFHAEKFLEVMTKVKYLEQADKSINLPDLSGRVYQKFRMALAKRH